MSTIVFKETVHNQPKFSNTQSINGLAAVKRPPEFPALLVPGTAPEDALCPELQKIAAQKMCDTTAGEL